VARGRTLLKDAVLRRMGPVQRLDARIYLAVNGIPHAPWSDRLANGLTVWTTGGWIWCGAVLLARLAGVPRARGAFWDMVPSVAAATWVVEHPVKALFRRRRPFVDVVRALVVGKKPGSWSFPSGHTAASFASAWIVSKSWPRRSPLFFGLAALVGCSRIYVGAHYPGDVVVGAWAGMALAEVANRLTRLLLRRVR
jgi:undecaprenyl-diphosphatase